jgi:hypothetical protein
LKVAFVPTNGRDKVTVKYKKDKVIFQTDFVDSTYVELDPELLTDDPIAHVNQQIAEQAPNAKKFTIATAEYEIAGSHTPDKIAEEVAMLMTKYSVGGSGYKVYNDAVNWLGGVIGHTFKNQASYKSYDDEKNRAKEEGIRLRRNKKARDRRAKDNKRSKPKK